MTISVVASPSQKWKTCDKSNKPFEFNIWTWAPRPGGHGWISGIFMNNNYLGDSANPWRNVCDGKLESDGAHVRLVAEKASIDLKRTGNDSAELRWSDKRWGINGTFKLEKYEP